MKPTTCNPSTKFQPDKAEPASPPETYFRVAQSIMPGVKVLAAASPPALLALALVSAHTLECLLKAYLSRDGSDKKLQKANICHNINGLWVMAFAEGLHILASPPGWVDSLSFIHGRPYYLRYSTGVRGILLPSAEPMASELAALLEVVREQLR
jgi:hypothetical protein